MFSNILANWAINSQTIVGPHVLTIMSDTDTTSEELEFDTSEDHRTTPELQPRTRYLRAERKQPARNWTFEQFELDRFNWKQLAHQNLVYKICQEQLKRGHTCMSGVLAFNKQVSYACVHKLIGEGDYCEINVAYAPVRCRLECYKEGSETLEVGTPPATFVKPDRVIKKRKRSKHYRSDPVRVSRPKYYEMNEDDGDDSESAYRKWALKKNQ